jgi:hypothetical protein
MTTPITYEMTQIPKENITFSDDNKTLKTPEILFTGNNETIKGKDVIITLDDDVKIVTIQFTPDDISKFSDTKNQIKFKINLKINEKNITFEGTPTLSENVVTINPVSGTETEATGNEATEPTEPVANEETGEQSGGKSRNKKYMKKNKGKSEKKSKKGGKRKTMKKNK